MNKFAFFILLVVLVTGCQPQTREVTETPTATIPPLAGEPIPVELSALAANPSVYENTYVQLVGQYTKQPRLVCESDPHPSPVTWGLSSDTLLALAGNFDEQLRPLLPEGLTMTVVGHWRHWQGDVGCGDVVQPLDLWYLQVTEIISPSPLTMVTLTPSGGPEAQGGDVPPGEGTPIAQITSTLPITESTGTAVTAVPQPPDVPPTETRPGATAVPDSTASATATTAVSIPGTTPTLAAPTITPGGTIAATTTPGVSGTPSPSATLPPGVTPSATSSTLSTGTPSPTPDDMGIADVQTPYMEFLESGKNHSWTFDNELPNNHLIIQVAPSAAANIAIAVYNPDGVQIANQNNAGTGAIETITNLSLPAEGLYEIILSDSTNASADYGLILLDDVSFNISFHQIDYGSPQNTSFTVEEEQIWFFNGSANDLITITADPSSGEPDIGFELLGRFADTLEYIDENFESSEPEVLSDYVLPENGLYAIWLFGIDDGTMNIQLSVSNND